MNLQDLLIALAGKVGPISASDGVTNPFRLGKTSALVTSDAHGKYHEAASRRKIFSNYAPAVAMSVPATAAIGNIVYNPPNSGVLMSILKITAACVVTDADMLMINACYSPQVTTPSTTSASVHSCLYTGGGLGACTGYGIATVTTAAIVLASLFHITAAINTVGVDALIFDADGCFCVPPGNVFTLHSIAAAAGSGVTTTVIWEEIPIP